MAKVGNLQVGIGDYLGKRSQLICQAIVGATVFWVIGPGLRYRPQTYPMPSAGLLE